MLDMALHAGKAVAAMPVLGHLLRLFVRLYNLYYAGGAVRTGVTPGVSSALVNGCLYSWASFGSLPTEPGRTGERRCEPSPVRVSPPTHPAAWRPWQYFLTQYRRYYPLYLIVVIVAQLAAFRNYGSESSIPHRPFIAPMPKAFLSQ